MLRDLRLSEDAVQEAFLQVWRQADSYSPAAGSVKTWILMLVHRRAVDLVRREERQARDPRCDRLVEGPPLLPADQQLGRRIRASLDALEPSLREVLTLAYDGGLSQRQIASQLGLPLGTVKSRTSSALLRLRAANRIA